MPFVTRLRSILFENLSINVPNYVNKEELLRNGNVRTSIVVGIQEGGDIGT